MQFCKITDAQAIALVDASLLKLTRLDLRSNPIGFKTGCYVLKKVMKNTAGSKVCMVKLQLTKVSALLVNSIEAATNEANSQQAECFIETTTACVA